LELLTHSGLDVRVRAKPDHSRHRGVIWLISTAKTMIKLQQLAAANRELKLVSMPEDQQRHQGGPW
jgi:hypothetical protein